MAIAGMALALGCSATDDSFHAAEATDGGGGTYQVGDATLDCRDDVDADHCVPQGGLGDFCSGASGGTVANPEHCIEVMQACEALAVSAAYSSQMTPEVCGTHFVSCRQLHPDSDPGCTVRCMVGSEPVIESFTMDLCATLGGACKPATQGAIGDSGWVFCQG